MARHPPELWALCLSAQTTFVWVDVGKLTHVNLHGKITFPGDLSSSGVWRALQMKWVEEARGPHPRRRQFVPLLWNLGEFRWEEPTCAQRANERKVLFIQTSQVVHSGSQAQPLSLGPQFLGEWKSLSSSIQGSGQPCQGLRRPGGTLRLSPGPQYSSGVTAVSLLQVSDLPLRLWGLRWGSSPHPLRKFLEQTREPSALGLIWQ